MPLLARLNARTHGRENKHEPAFDVVFPVFCSVASGKTRVAACLQDVETSEVLLAKEGSSGKFSAQGFESKILLLKPRQSPCRNLRSVMEMGYNGMRIGIGKDVHFFILRDSSLLCQCPRAFQSP